VLVSSEKQPEQIDREEKKSIVVYAESREFLRDLTMKRP